jgi:hypothetical protein
MPFLAFYKLPDDIGEFIATGRESAESRTSLIITQEQLIKVFSGYFDLFIRSTRNDPFDVTESERRDYFQMAVGAAASLCYVANLLRHNSDTHEVKTHMEKPEKIFYHHYTNGSIHPEILEWLDIVMVDSERPRRAEAVEALKGLFEIPDPAERRNQPPNPSPRAA